MISKGDLNIKNIYLGNNNIISVYKGTEKIFPSGGSAYSKEYFTFETLQSCSFKFSKNAIEYSLSGGKTWATLPKNTSSPTITAGNKILFRANLISVTSGNDIGTFSSTGKFNAEGNVMSLLYGDDFKNQTSLAGKKEILARLFLQCTNLISTENLILPATTLTDTCYAAMFNGCTSLTTAPTILPATTLAYNCYNSMFYGCTSLAIAPILPATVLVSTCYRSMFDGCTSLVAAPVLPAPILVDNCYNSMFRGCIALSYVKCLATDISASNCIYWWLAGGVPSTGTFVKASSMTSWPSGINGIPSGWTVQNA